MRKSLIVIAAVLAARPASAEETEREHIVLFYEGVILEAFSYDTGWLPDPSSDVRVRFLASVDGDVLSELRGTTWLEWPEAFQFHMEGDPDGGDISVEYGIDLSMQIEYDLGILGSGSYDVPLDDWLLGMPDIRAWTRFTPFLLAGHPDAPVSFEGEGTYFEIVDAPIALTTGVVLNLILGMEPELSCNFRGEGVDLTPGVRMTVEGGPAAIPYDLGGSIVIPVAYDGHLYCNFAVTLIPTVSLCIGTCYDVDLFEIDIHVTDEGATLDFDPVTVTHTYPVMRLDTLSMNFGTVEVGDEAFMDLTVGNTGTGYLEVSFDIDPWDGPFSFFPLEGIIVPGGEERSVRVFFYPAGPGDFEASLHVESNAPADNAADVSIRGSGAMPETPPSDADTDGPCEESADQTAACGCRVAGQGPGPTGALALVMLALVLVRRRLTRPSQG